MAASAGYVRTDEGNFLLEIPDPDSRWGFYLCSDDQSWDGGFDAVPNGQGWDAVPDDEVPEDVRELLGPILDLWRDEHPEFIRVAEKEE